MQSQPPPPDTRKRIPLAQVFFDDIFLLLFIGLITPFLIYVVWGLVNIASTPPAPYGR